MHIKLRVSYIEPVDDTPDVPTISYKAALDFLEGLRLLRLQNPHANRQKGEQLEGLQGMARIVQQQTTTTGFLDLGQTFPNFFVHISI